MQILLDPQIFNVQKFGGISRLYSEILLDLKSRKDVKLYCPLHYTDNYHILNYKLSKNRLLKRINIKPIRSIKKRLLKKNYATTLDILKSGNIDVFIPSYYNPYFLEFLNDTPFVLTIYDMIHELYPHYLDETEELVIHNKKILLERAEVIIAISNNTKSDILKFYPFIPEEKIKVVYLSQSISKDSLDQIKIQKVIGEKFSYVLFVGNRGLYKNFEWFIQSASDWLSENNVNLLCLGGGAFNLYEEQLIEDLKLKERVVQYTFQDDELFGFYNQALAFVFPSQYEGFGIPVLESMFSGCPVILPKVSSFPEVAGEAGIYIDLSEKISLTEALDKVLFDNDYRKAKIDLGYLQAEKFSWNNTVSECLDIYKTIVSSSVKS